METPVFAYADAITEIEEFAREASISTTSRGIRSPIRRAYREIVECHDWACLHINGRIMLQAAQDTGTVTYTHAGGLFARLLTLVGATWPADIADWSVRIETADGPVVCDVATRLTDTQVMLDATLNPGEDVAAGASYSAYPRYYRLPNDFRSMDRPVEESFQGIGQYVTFEKMMELSQEDSTPGTITYYTVASIPDLIGSWGLYVYKRIPRDLRYGGTDLAEAPGTIAVAAGSAAVLGTTTTFSSGHEGSLLRIGSSATRVPTGLDGLYPYVEQRVITTYNSALSLTLDNTVNANASGVKYSITDPIDLDPSAYDAMIALAKKYLAMEKNAKNWQAVAALADERLRHAKGGDNRVYSRVVCGNVRRVVELSGNVVESDIT
jgi:hypothetical protein